MKHILIVGSFPNAQKKLLATNDCRLTLITRTEELRFGTEGIQLAEQTLVHPYDDLEQLTQKIIALHTADPFDGVLSFAEEGLLPAAVLAERLQVPGLEVKPVQCTSDKFLMRQALDEIPTVNLSYARCTTVAEAVAFFRQVAGPIVLKPLEGQGSRGVMFVQSEQEIETAFAYSMESSRDAVLAESFVSGKEFSVETFTHDGKHEVLAITDKHNTGAPHFVGTFHSLPSMESDDVQAMIIEKINVFLDCIGLTFGPAHTEITLTPSGIKIIESQIRPGGRIYHMIEAAFGIDVFAQTFYRLFDEPYLPKEGQGAAAIAFIQATPGIITHINGVDEMKQDPAVYDFFLRGKWGGRVETWQNSSHRLGHIICVGTSAQEAIAHAERMRSRLEIITTPEERAVT